jgi:RNA polymerase-binding transcription factor DksA
MIQHNIDTERSALGQRRHALTQRWFAALEGEAELLADRPPDWEDLAAEQRDGAMLNVLGEMEHNQLEAIRAALARVDAGTYGTCAACEEEIDPARLAAIPEAALCIGCQDLADHTRAPHRGGSPHTH